jgi:acetamidase/formamidase
VIHELPLDRRTIHGRWSRDLEPVLTIDPGDSVRLQTLGAFWADESGEPAFERADDDGHALSGPIAVRGAQKGATLSVRIDAVDPGSRGVTLTSYPHKVDWELADGVGRSSSGQAVRLAPFLGVIGMPPDEPGTHSTEPPRASGGNIDCKELVAGSTLYLPIPVDGALLSAGDAHARQGDGEVSGTAIETTSRTRLTIDVRTDLELEWPIARTKDAWLAFGFDRDLGVAARIAKENMLALLTREHGFAADDALALASVAVDLRVTQVVNDVLGVHAVLADDAFL